MAKDYSRQASGNRFVFNGMKTNSSADSMPEGKFPIAVNIRGYAESSVTSRPQVVQSQAPPAVGPGPVLALEPNIGVYKIGPAIYLAGTQIDTGYQSGVGCSFVQYRPNESTNSYEYVFDNNKGRKVLSASVVQNIGIAEPQSSPECAPTEMGINEVTLTAASWVAGGTAGALSDQTRTTDTAGVVLLDPGFSGAPNHQRASIQVGTTIQYQVGEVLKLSLGGPPVGPFMVEDVLPPMSTGSGIQIRSIFYFVGTTGRCVIVPTQMLSNMAVPGDLSVSPQGASPFIGDYLASLRRGSLIKLSGSNEIVLVRSVSKGPDGSIAIETSTTINHAAGETITGVPAIVVSGVQINLVAGNTVTAASIQSAIAAGVGTITQTNAGLGISLFGTVFSGGGPQVTIQINDYLHVSLQVSDLTLLTEIKFMFDVGDGSFTQNFYYYAIRPSDLAPAVANTQTQLGTGQIVAQRRSITATPHGVEDIPGLLLSDSGPAPITTGPLGPHFPITNIGDQTSPGSSQWSEISFPITALTRIGDDQTKTLANCGAVRIQLQGTGAITLQFGGVSVWGGGQVDTGVTGSPYFYRVRPRNSVAGVIGNPSPSTRYGVAPRRQSVVVQLPSAAYDPQIDTWDVFRTGGEINAWKYVGSTPSTNASFTDTVFDSSITGSPVLSFDNHEPFPSIGPAISTTTATVQGTIMSATFPLASLAPNSFGTLSQLGALLPGNLLLVGTLVFTLRSRPVFLSSTGTTQTYQFEFEENAGVQNNPAVLLQEPALASQDTNRVWGPDANGSIFAVAAGNVNNNGIGLRAGLIQRTNPNNPDGASDQNTDDLCPPTEPLQNGALVGDTSIVFSPDRAWAGYPKSDGSGGYDWREIPVGRGLAAPLGICSDGRYVYYVAKDSIRRTAGGNSESLTDDDLFNLFPHEGVFPQNVTYAGQTVFAPEYKYAANMVLAVVNNFLYFDYLDSTQTQRTLVCDLRKLAWSVDVGITPFTIHAGTKAAGSNAQAPSSAVRNQLLFIGDTSGAINVEQSVPSSGSGEIVACTLATKEEMLGDLRAKKIFGDASLDLFAAGGTVQATPVFLGTAFGTITALAGGQLARSDPPAQINLNGGQTKRSMGLLLQWSDQGQNTTLYDWQPSYIPQPEDTGVRFTDWDDAGSVNAKFFQGFELEADTSGVQKAFVVRDADTLQVHPFSSASGVNLVNHNGQQIKAYSFVTPFVAHLVRIEPQDNISWRLFGVKWEGQPTPESVLNWQTQGSSLGLPGYKHIQHIMAAYASTAPVTLTISAFDGVSPAVITLPSTAGQYRKLSFILTPNKGLLYTFQAVSAQPWTPFLNDWEIDVKEWGSSGGYQTYKNIGGPHGAEARI